MLTYRYVAYAKAPSLFAHPASVDGSVGLELGYLHSGNLRMMIDQQVDREPKHIQQAQPQNKGQGQNQYIEEIDLQKYWLVLKRRWLPATAVFSVTVLLSLAAALSQDSVYRADGKVLFRRDRTASLTGLSEDLGQVEILSREPLETQAELVRSLPVMEEAVLALDLRNAEGELVPPRSLLKKVKVQPVPATDILRISVQSTDPSEAAVIVNQVIESYRNQNIANNREEAAAARRFIEEQLPTTEIEVSRVEALLRQFKENNGVILLEQEAETAVSVLSNLDRDITQLQSQLADTDARLIEVQGQLGMDVSTALTLSALNQADGVQEVLAEIQAVQTELSTERSRYRAGHPSIVTLERQQSELQALLNSRVREILQLSNAASTPVGGLQMSPLQQTLISDSISELQRLQVERSGLANRMTQLEESRESYRQRVEKLPKLEKLQRDLERRLQATQTTYETLLSQLQEIRVVENQTVGNVRIVSLADVPNNPVGPNRKLYLVGGAAMGSLLAIAIAFLLDLLDSSVKNIKEVRELFGYTLLGVIPLLKPSGGSDSDSLNDAFYPRVLVNQLAHTEIRDSYQMLQANLRFLQSDTALKALVVSSSVAGEGKSEVAVNLAVAFAQVGRRVLLVDADMRHPHQHHALRIMNGEGLSHIIAGQATLDSAIQTVMEGLDVLTAGVVPPNPIALLDSQRMESLLQIFTHNYDMVIVDAPPLVNYADASILGKMAGALLLVARPGVVNYSQGRAAKATAERSNQRVVGLVVNGVNPKNEPDSYFYWAGQESSLPSKGSQSNLVPVQR